MCSVLERHIRILVSCLMRITYSILAIVISTPTSIRFPVCKKTLHPFLYIDTRFRSINTISTKFTRIIYILTFQIRVYKKRQKHKGFLLIFSSHFQFVNADFSRFPMISATREKQGIPKSNLIKISWTALEILTR
jgi:hypothetical protein